MFTKISKMFFRRIFGMLSKIHSGTIFALLPPNTAFMAISAFTFEHVMNMNFVFRISETIFNILWWWIRHEFHFFQSNWDFTMILVGGISLICSLCWPFLCCYFATHTSDRINSISQMVYNSNWHNYPLKLQKYIVLVIARSQKRSLFTGFNLVACTLYTFGNVSSIDWREFAAHFFFKSNSFEYLIMFLNVYSSFVVHRARIILFSERLHTIKKNIPIMMRSWKCQVNDKSLH